MINQKILCRTLAIVQRIFDIHEISERGYISSLGKRDNIKSIRLYQQGGALSHGETGRQCIAQ
jgi:hypothetical protein